MALDVKIILFVGEPDEGAAERFTELGFATAAAEGEIADRMQWMCAFADAVYMGPQWRASLTDRAMRATALAAGLEVLGFE